MLRLAIKTISSNVLKISSNAGNYLRVPKSGGADIRVGAITMRVRNWTSNFLLDARKQTLLTNGFIWSGSNGTIGDRFKVYNENQVQYDMTNTAFYNNSNWSFLYIVPQVEDQLYQFSSHTFTNCGKTGTTGPSLANCTATYTPSWTDNTSYLNVQTAGYQEWTVPISGTYRISAYGAQGGPNSYNNNSSTAGNGAYVRGDFSLTKGEVIYIAVGQRGETTAEGGGGEGGDGGGGGD